MNQEIKAPEYEVLTFLPQDFFNKNVNEEFIKLVMSSIFSEGEWVKGIAGDDLLLPDCIETYMNYVKEVPNSILIFGKALTFSTKLGKRIFRRKYLAERSAIHISEYLACQGKLEHNHSIKLHR